jgi:3-dehydroquinate synthase
VPKTYHFQFGGFLSAISVQQRLPAVKDFSGGSENFLAVCDEHTVILAERMGFKPENFPEGNTLILPPGENHKDWNAVEAILQGAAGRGLGRDGLFIGIGGGVITDLTAFAASIYMRGARLALVPTTLLAMADAALGGKTGFDLEGLKNFAGTFYPAQTVYIVPGLLKSLPEREWKSGMAELIKTAVLDKNPKTLVLFENSGESPGPDHRAADTFSPDLLEELLIRAVHIKGNIVTSDPREQGSERALLNLGHTFGHALESAAGLGKLTHGEAVAWGMARACELGMELEITPLKRARQILKILENRGYETRVPHPFNPDNESFMNVLLKDKKKKKGVLRFVVPGKKRAELVVHDKKVQTYLERTFGPQ